MLQSAKVVKIGSLFVKSWALWTIFTPYMGVLAGMNATYMVPDIAYELS